MRFDKATMREAWKDFGVFLSVGLTFGLLFALGASFLKVYEDSMRVRQRARLVASIVREQGDTLFHEQAGTAAPVTPAREREDEVKEIIPLRRWIIERFAASRNDPRVVAKDLDQILNRPNQSPFVVTALRRWQATLSRWSTGMSENSEDSKSPHALILLIEGRQHYFESAGFRRIGRSFDGTVLDLWTISLLTKFVEKYPLHPAVPEALFMMGDEYLNLGSALPRNVKSDRILNLVSELYPDSIWANRANAIWKSERAHAI
jgi:hypothetical protein